MLINHARGKCISEFSSEPRKDHRQATTADNVEFHVRSNLDWSLALLHLMLFIYLRSSGSSSTVASWTLKSVRLIKILVWDTPATRSEVTVAAAASDRSNYCNFTTEMFYFRPHANAYGQRQANSTSGITSCPSGVMSHSSTIITIPSTKCRANLHLGHYHWLVAIKTYI